MKFEVNKKVFVHLQKAAVESPMTVTVSPMPPQSKRQVQLAAAARALRAVEDNLHSISSLDQLSSFLLPPPTPMMPYCPFFNT